MDILGFKQENSKPSVKDQSSVHGGSGDFKSKGAINSNHGLEKDQMDQIKERSYELHSNRTSIENTIKKDDYGRSIQFDTTNRKSLGSRSTNNHSFVESLNLQANNHVNEIEIPDFLKETTQSRRRPRGSLPLSEKNELFAGVSNPSKFFKLEDEKEVKQNGSFEKAEAPKLSIFDILDRVPKNPVENPRTVEKDEQSTSLSSLASLSDTDEEDKTPTVKIGKVKSASTLNTKKSIQKVENAISTIKVNGIEHDQEQVKTLLIRFLI
jgi:hypothetical protein